MKKIPLTNSSKYALVDNDIYDLICHTKWYIDNGGYPTGTYNKKKVRLHKLVTNFIQSRIDHKDQNKLNNTRNNLRIVSNRENSLNSKMRKHNTSGYRGVTFCKSTNKWRATIRLNNKNICLGRYYNKIDAAKAYNIAAIKYNGEFAQLNKI